MLEPTQHKSVDHLVSTAAMIKTSAPVCMNFQHNYDKYLISKVPYVCSYIITISVTTATAFICFFAVMDMASIVLCGWGSLF